MRLIQRGWLPREIFQEARVVRKATQIIFQIIGPEIMSPPATGTIGVIHNVELRKNIVMRLFISRCVRRAQQFLL